jgi:hypothetical protein
MPPAPAHEAEDRIETKFKDAVFQRHHQGGAETIHSGNLYPLFAYLKNEERA